MLVLDEPASYYFETCRRIMWSRLTYDRPYILHSKRNSMEVLSIWEAALVRTMSPVALVDAYPLLNGYLQSDETSWEDLAERIEQEIDMPAAISDYFFGSAARDVITAIEGGGYRTDV